LLKIRINFYRDTFECIYKVNFRSLILHDGGRLNYLSAKDTKVEDLMFDAHIQRDIEHYSLIFILF
jgi:hypothetical protein